jgi:ADP-ribose pyrophosphatase YjhB (NUDIX family)
VRRLDGGRDRASCPSEGCGYTHYGDASIGTGAVVLREGRVLLIERRAGERRYWQIPGGYVEVDEPIDAAIEREVLEETGVTARVVDCLGFRHAAGLPDRPAANLYVVFRLEAAAGEPRPDGEESFAAGFFSRQEIAALPGLTATSAWAIDQAAERESLRGLMRVPPREGLHRPGHTLFGVLLQ